MFTIQRIKAAHAKTKTGADFPRYVQEIKELGLISYEFMLTDGHIVYFGANNYRVEAPPVFPTQAINPIPSAVALKHTIEIHQQGQTDFMTFCRQAADAGVYYWEVNTQTMLCAYFDSNGEIMVAEAIPDTYQEDF